MTDAGSSAAKPTRSGAGSSAPNTPTAYLATAAEGVIILLTLAYLVSGGQPVLLIAWESAALIYLVAGFVAANREAHRGADTGRQGTLGTLSWVLPLVTSLAGVYSAGIALVAKSSSGHDHGSLFLTIAASIGIVLSWVLLHTGLAQIYQWSFARNADEPGLKFPSTKDPLLLDFLYFSFAIGAAFATSDTQVLTRRMRRNVMVHSVIGFFYNAFVIAVAFQVLQALLAGE